VNLFSNPDIRGDAIPFEVELNEDANEKTVLTNLITAIAIFTFDQQDYNLWSPMGVEALSFALASHIAFTLTGKLSLAQATANTFQNIILLAPAYNANEMVEKPPREAEHIRGRA